VQRTLTLRRRGVGATSGGAGRVNSIRWLMFRTGLLNIERRRPSGGASGDRQLRAVSQSGRDADRGWTRLPTAVAVVPIVVHLPGDRERQ